MGFDGRSLLFLCFLGLFLGFLTVGLLDVCRTLGLSLGLFGRFTRLCLCGYDCRLL